MTLNADRRSHRPHWGGTDGQDTANLLAVNSPSQEQTTAADHVMTGTLRRAQDDLWDRNPGSLPDFAPARWNTIRQALTGERRAA